MEKNNVKNLILAALLLGFGIVLPFFTMQIKEIGDSLLPMHFTVLLCSLICGWKYGGAVGFATPLLRGLLFGMPPLYPNGIYMTLELSTYGILTSLLYTKVFKNRFWGIYPSLVLSMIGGRIVWGISKAVLLGLGNNTYSFYLFFTEGFIDGFSGIIIQLIFIPLIVKFIERYLNTNEKTFF